MWASLLLLPRHRRCFWRNFRQVNEFIFVHFQHENSTISTFEYWSISTDLNKAEINNWVKKLQFAFDCLWGELWNKLRELKNLLTSFMNEPFITRYREPGLHAKSLFPFTPSLKIRLYCDLYAINSNPIESLFHFYCCVRWIHA